MTIKISDKVTVGDDTGLVGHWSFNGSDMRWDLVGAEARDTSGNGNHGAVIGAVPTQGHVGQGLSFNGTTDYVECDSVASGDESTWNGITVMAWVKHISYVPIDQEIIRFGSNWLGGNDLLDGYGFGFRTLNGDSIAGDQGELVPNLNQWYQVVGTYDKTNVILYVDGIEIDRETNTGSIVDFNDFLICRRVDPNRKVNGSIDDVRIYNRALSAQEIGDQYRQGARKLYA